MHAHRIYFHSTVKNYQCGLCGEKFEACHLLRRHFLGHKNKGELTENLHGDSNGAAQYAESDCSDSLCEICHTDYGVEGLEVHMLSHDVKPFKCECSGVFFSESEYMKHIKDDCEVARNSLEHVKAYKVDNDAPFKEESDFDSEVKEEYDK